MYSTDNSKLISDIKLGKEREEAAIKFLLDQNADKITSWIIKQNGSREDAEDILFESITELLLQIRANKFRGQSSIHTYLFAISKYSWYSFFNRKMKKKEKIGSHELTKINLLNPEQILIDEEEEYKIDQIMQILGVKCKKLLNMWAYKYSMKEIAKELNYSSPQVAMNKKNNCLKRIKEHLRAKES